MAISPPRIARIRAPWIERGEIERLVRPAADQKQDPAADDTPGRSRMLRMARGGHALAAAALADEADVSPLRHDEVDAADSSHERRRCSCEVDAQILDLSSGACSIRRRYPNRDRPRRAGHRPGN